MQVVPDGRFIYTANFTGFSIIDTADINNPEIYAEVETPGIARSLCLRKDYAIVSIGHGLQIIHIKNKQSPTLLNLYKTEEDIRKIYLRDKILYAATDQGLLIYNASNPEKLRLINKTRIPGNFMDVFVLGDHAYLADYDKGLVIVDVSKETHPNQVSICKTEGYPRGVYVSGNYAYLADFEKGLQVINIRNSEKPFPAGSYATSGDTRGITFMGKYAFVADGRAGICIYESQLKEVEDDGSVKRIPTEGNVKKPVLF